MRILFLSTNDVDGASLCHRLLKEGNHVRIFHNDGDDDGFGILENIIPRERDFEKAIDWVGKSGLIVADDSGFGNIQDILRGRGYRVVGGGSEADRIEDDREYCHDVFASAGVEALPQKQFFSLEEATKFLKENQGPWVIKQNGHLNKTINYVGRYVDNRDMLSLLENYNKNSLFQEDLHKHIPFTLQKKVEGIEVGVGRYFNGHDWVGPIEINLEHKDFFENNLGPKTYEMGTLMWYSDDENNKLFKDVLGKFKSYLRKINFKGDFDINCIVNENGIYPLEATARFGYPAVQAQMELHKTPWTDFLGAIADGDTAFELDWKSGYSVVVLVAVPPFPFYQRDAREYSPKGIQINIDQLTQDDLRHVHFDEIAFHPEMEKYVVAGEEGYVLHVTGHGETVENARSNAYEIIQKLILPKMYYRSDIGLQYMQKQGKLLKQWGYNLDPYLK